MDRQNLDRQLVEARGSVRTLSQQLAGVFDEASSAMAFLDASARVQRANPAFYELLGSPPHCVTDLSLNAVVAPQCRDVLEEGIESLRQGSAARTEIELRLAGPRKTWIWASLKMVALRGVDGALEGLVLHVLDVARREQNPTFEFDLADSGMDESRPLGPSALPRLSVPGEGTTSPVDLQLLRARIGTREAAFRKIAEAFERDALRLLTELLEQAEVGDAAGGAAVAHSLKGILRNVCAFESADIAEKLERCSRDGRWDELVRQAQELERRTVRIASQLREAGELSVPVSPSEIR